MDYSRTEKKMSVTNKTSFPVMVFDLWLVYKLKNDRGPGWLNELGSWIT